VLHYPRRVRDAVHVAQYQRDGPGGRGMEPVRVQQAADAVDSFRQHGAWVRDGAQELGRPRVGEILDFEEQFGVGDDGLGWLGFRVGLGVGLGR
jgi:hypothetical protein